MKNTGVFSALLLTVILVGGVAVSGGLAVPREKGTERAFSGKYDKHHEHGVYRCAACGLDLYRSEEKYDSGTGGSRNFGPVAVGFIRRSRRKASSRKATRS
jgi:peptide methionine sulfoxide reductase MsrB